MSFLTKESDIMVDTFTIALWVVGITVGLFLLILTYALCKTAKKADEINRHKEMDSQ
jgi:beta-lactamase regulating signal transducer with metallopeptidase domain